jgi:hypothetical protein
VGGRDNEKVTNWLQNVAIKKIPVRNPVFIPKGWPSVVTLWALRPSYQPGGSRRSPHVATTFIFRTVGLRRAVEDFVGGVLLTLVGHTDCPAPHWVGFAPLPSFVSTL